jgi:hypothetical protein
VNDYHRYHFPVAGKVLEQAIIPAYDAVGGLVSWNQNQQKYVLNSRNPNWEAIETRGYVILQTAAYGKVALLPVGMSQVSSVNFDPQVRVGAEFKKGDELGYFLFGGSDFIMIFQKDVNVKLAVKPEQNGSYPHLLMGQKYATLSKALPRTTPKAKTSKTQSEPDSTTNAKTSAKANSGSVAKTTPRTQTKK